MARRYIATFLCIQFVLLGGTRLVFAQEVGVFWDRGGVPHDSINLGDNELGAATEGQEPEITPAEDNDVPGTYYYSWDTSRAWSNNNVPGDELGEELSLHVYVSHHSYYTTNSPKYEPVVDSLPIRISTGNYRVAGLTVGGSDFKDSVPSNYPNNYVWEGTGGFPVPLTPVGGELHIVGGSLFVDNSAIQKDVYIGGDKFGPNYAEGQPEGTLLIEGSGMMATTNSFWLGDRGRGILILKDQARLAASVFPGTGHLSVGEDLGHGSIEISDNAQLFVSLMDIRNGNITQTGGLVSTLRNPQSIILGAPRVLVSDAPATYEHVGGEVQVGVLSISDEDVRGNYNQTGGRLCILERLSLANAPNSHPNSYTLDDAEPSTIATLLFALGTLQDDSAYVEVSTEASFRVVSGRVQLDVSDLLLWTPDGQIREDLIIINAEFESAAFGSVELVESSTATSDILGSTLEYINYTNRGTGLHLHTDSEGRHWGLAIRYFPNMNGKTDVTVRTTLLGDVDCDNDVDEGDFNIMAGNWGTTEFATWEMGDFSGDGKVDIADHSLMAGNWQVSYNEEE